VTILNAPVDGIAAKLPGHGDVDREDDKRRATSDGVDVKHGVPQAHLFQSGERNGLTEHPTIAPIKQFIDRATPDHLCASARKSSSARSVFRRSSCALFGFSNPNDIARRCLKVFNIRRLHSSWRDSMRERQLPSPGFAARYIDSIMHMRFAVTIAACIGALSSVVLATVIDGPGRLDLTKPLRAVRIAGFFIVFLASFMPPAPGGRSALGGVSGGADTQNGKSWSTTLE
jgi:hypothetical protein